VPGVTVDRQCGSSQQAVHFAAQAVLSGTADLVMAGGVQNMSMVPIAAAMSPPYPDPFSGSAGWRARYGAEEISQFRAADLIADKWGIGRAEMERYALASHHRALTAIDAGAFRAEIVPCQDVTADECPRADTTLEKMAALPPLRPGGTITAALAWQRETGADLARVNVCGGAIALGHPLGATGARLLTTLLGSLERTGGRYGMLTMCEGGGQANVTIIERV
jgi:acetyl-CoA C-acetyltransferase